MPLVGLVLLQGVALEAQGVVCGPPLAFGESLCGVAGAMLEPVEPVEGVVAAPVEEEPIEEPLCEPVVLLFMPVDEEPMLLPVAVPVELFGVALSWVLDGVEGVEGEVVVVVLCVVVVLAPVWPLAVSVLVLCASASVPVRSRPAARIDTFFI